MKVVEKAGKQLEEGILTQLQAYIPRVVLSEQERAQAMARLMRHAGAVNLGHPTGADNESIGVDLAQGYGSTHEEQSVEFAQWDRLSDEALVEFEKGL